MGLMKLWGVCLTALCFWACAAVAEDSPAAALLQSGIAEDEIVTRVRNYDILQSAMADWDDEMMKNYLAINQPDMAQERRVRMAERYDAIEAAWRTVLDRFPNNARAVNYFGELMYDHRGDVDEGLRSWKLAERLDRNLAEARNNLALHYLENGDFEMGLRYLDEAIKLDPDNPDFLFNMAQIYLINWPQVQQYRKWKADRVYKEAMKASRAAVSMKPFEFELLQDYALNYFTAERFEVEPDWKEAAEAWQLARSMAYKPEHTFNAYINEARCWMRDGNGAKAEACLVEAEKILPGSPVVKTLMGRIQSGQLGPAAAEEQ